MQKHKATVSSISSHPYKHLITKLNNHGFFFSLKMMNDSRINKLPYCIRILLENMIRNCDNYIIKQEDVENLLNWRNTSRNGNYNLIFNPSRVLLQDFTGVPAVVDLAVMRDSLVKEHNMSGQLINPLVPVDLVIDHSVQVDKYGHKNAVKENLDIEFKRNYERFKFLKWGSKSFDNFRVVPPGFGIVHQVNLEYLAKGIFKVELSKDELDYIDDKQNTDTEFPGLLLYPDTLVGTDSHTTMICGLGILGWGVGGLEAESAMLGQPITMVIPEVLGVELVGKMDNNITGTDVVLTVTSILRQKNVVGKFVEFYGTGVKELSIADRATISNMSPEYGATAGFFRSDKYSMKYWSHTGREEMTDFIEDYLKENMIGCFNGDNEAEIQYSERIIINLSKIEPCLAGPKRPQDKVYLKNVKSEFLTGLVTPLTKRGFGIKQNELKKCIKYKEYEIKHGSLAIASITSCTNTSNPFVMLGAGLLAKKAVEQNLTVPKYVKTSLSPGSHVVEEYLKLSNLIEYMEKLGFYTTGFGCMTCIGNSGELDHELSELITSNDLVMASVLSGNRNFEGRIHPLVKANYLTSPLLVIAFAIAGRIDIDLYNEPLQINNETGKEIYLKDIWPTREEIFELESKVISPNLYKKVYKGIKNGTEHWNSLLVEQSTVYQWDPLSTYIHKAPFLENNITKVNLNQNINAKCLLILGDSVTTDHISPAGNIAEKSPAGRFLLSKNIMPIDFNTYGSRRGNDEVMVRGTFANIRIVNRMIYNENNGSKIEGPYTLYLPTKEVLPIYDAAMKYKENNINNLLVIAGKEYGTGSSRDWAAKGSKLLGVQYILASSFERIHRSNLICMGIMPLQFMEGDDYVSLGLDGTEDYSIDLSNNLKPKSKITIKVTRSNDETFKFDALIRFDTQIEIDYYSFGGILPYILNKIVQTNSNTNP